MFAINGTCINKNDHCMVDCDIQELFTQTIWKVPDLFKLLADSNPLCLATWCLDVLWLQCTPNGIASLSYYTADSGPTHPKVKGQGNLLKDFVSFFMDRCKWRILLKSYL